MTLPDSNPGLTNIGHCWQGPSTGVMCGEMAPKSSEKKKEIIGWGTVTPEWDFVYYYCMQPTSRKREKSLENKKVIFPAPMISCIKSSM